MFQEFLTLFFESSIDPETHTAILSTINAILQLDESSTRRETMLSFDENSSLTFKIFNWIKQSMAKTTICPLSSAISDNTFMK